MRKEVVALTIWSCTILLTPTSLAKPTHLENLKARYPYGVIGDDYGLLTQEDLAVNTCNTLKITPFGGDKNLAYSYWQCFLLKDVQMKCDSLGYDSTVKMETGYLVVEAQNVQGFQSYVARDARDLRDCKEFQKVWKRKTRGEKYVCLSGSSNVVETAKNGRKEFNWVFDKFKTRKGCESRGVYCRLKDIEASVKSTCLRPK